MSIEHGVNSQRIRSLPAAVMAYYCMALSLYPEAAYAEVYSVIVHGLAWTRSGVAVPAVAAGGSHSCAVLNGEVHRRDRVLLGR